MNRSLARGVIVVLLMTQFIALVLPQVLNVSYVKAQATRTIRAIDFMTGQNSTALGNESEPFPASGQQFTLNITLNGETSDLFGWQIGVKFDNNSLRCNSILIPETDPSYVFYGKQGLAVSDLSAQDTLQEVVAGGGLFNPGDSVTIYNVLLCVLNFTVLKVGSFNVSFVVGDTFILDSFNIPMPSETVGFQCSAVGARSKPVAAFTFLPQNPRANQTVEFDGSSSYDPSGQNIALFIWDFGDNTTAANMTSSHAYSANGMYLVNLTVFTTDNVTNSKILSIIVGSVPIVAFGYLPIVVVPNDEVIFNASESAGVNSTIISYLWDFGDNATFLGNTSTANHRYSSNGVYYVNLTVGDEYGVFNSTSIELQVGVPPVPLFSFSPQSPIVNDTVTFSAVESPSIATYEWDFGEGLGVAKANISTITHIFYAEENYTITLTVFDIDGLHQSHNQTIFIFSPLTERAPDYSAQIFLGVVASLFVVILAVRVVRKRLRKKEVALDI
jgi:PKD repeat protein